MSFVLASNQPGGLPVTIPFTVPVTGDVTLAFSSTAWATTAGTTIGVDAYLDGALIGRALLCSNFVSEHRTLPTVFCPISLGEGPHKLTLQASNASTVTDQNDYFSAWILD